MFELDVLNSYGLTERRRCESTTLTIYQVYTDFLDFNVPFSTFHTHSCRSDIPQKAYECV